MNTDYPKNEIEKAKRVPLNPHVEQALEEIGQEVMWALAAHGVMASAHEGYAVILEELDELWEQVRQKRADRDRAWMMRHEAMQIAAMAVKFMLGIEAGR
jgi:hypothetical protein